MHLNEEGNRRLAEIIDRDLFGAPPRPTRATTSSALQRAVAEKSFQWFNRYRTTDAFATFGDRAFLTFIRGNPRNVNASSREATRQTSCRPTTKCSSAKSRCSIS